ncbi:MAG: hypothetical protein JNM13_12950 [Hyphomicrobiaceae bacterium]|nr:hypothetical protein [Hyphomicrobiaceae bacterium]
MKERARKARTAPKPAIVVNPVAKALAVLKPKVVESEKAYKRRPKNRREAGDGGEPA